MNKTLQNILAVLAGLIVGNIVNMSIISISSSVVPLPEGIDPNDFESMKANFHLFKPSNFIMPFLAHALGSLAGAFTAVKIAKSHKLTFALSIGVLFLVGGILMVFMLPGTPIWFILLDLIVAYIPMAWLGWKLGNREN